MQPRNLYVKTLFNIIKNENLSLDERNRRASIAIKAIAAAKPVYEKFKQDNPELTIDQADEVSFDARDENGETLLICAVDRAHIGIVEALLAAKADPNKANEKTGLTPLTYAAFHGHIAIMEVLLSAKADIDMLDRHGRSVLDWSIEEDGNILAVHFLLKSNAKINDFEYLRKFLFLRSQNQGDPLFIECFRMILENEAIQLEKLCGLYNAYGIFCSYFIPENA